MSAKANPALDLDSRTIVFGQRLTMLHFAMMSIASAYDAHGAPSEQVMFGLADLLGEMVEEFNAIEQESCDQHWRDLAKSKDPKDQELLRIVRRHHPERFTGKPKARTQEAG